MITKNDLKFIKSLKIKKYRSREGKFLVEGLKNVNELLNSDFEIDRVLCTKEYEKYFPGRCDIVSKDQLNSISTYTHNESCLAVAKIMPFTEQDLHFRDHVVVLSGVRDPGNLGTIIRSLDWFGFDQVVCSPDCAEFYNPKAITASMGSFCRVRGIYTNLDSFLEKVDRRVLALTLSGQSIENLRPTEPSLFVLGSESHGIAPETLEKVDAEVTIPRLGKAESLNVAMTASILLYHLRLGK